MGQVKKILGRIMDAAHLIWHGSTRPREDKDECDLPFLYLDGQVMAHVDSLTYGFDKHADAALISATMICSAWSDGYAKVLRLAKSHCPCKARIVMGASGLRMESKAHVTRVSLSRSRGEPTCVAFDIVCEKMSLS